MNQVYKQLLVKAGLPVFRLLGFLIWGGMLLLTIILWVTVGFILFRATDDRGLSLNMAAGQFVSAIGVFGVAVSEIGRAHV